MRISSHCNDPTESDSQFGCISLIAIATVVTATVLAFVLIGFLAWRQRRKDRRAHRAARLQNIDLERAFSANAFTRTDSMASEIGAPPSYHSTRDDDVLFVSAPAEGTLPLYEEKRGDVGGRVQGLASGSEGASIPDVGGAGKYPTPETRNDSLDLSIEDPSLEQGGSNK